MNKEFNMYLTSIYQGTCTALQSIEDIMSKVEDENLKKELSNEYSNYDVIARECELLAKSEDINLKDNSVIEKIKLWGSIKMTTLLNKSTRHLTEMLIIGTIMGIIQCIKDQSDYKAVSQELDDLNQRLLDIEDKNFENLKPFLE